MSRPSEKEVYDTIYAGDEKYATPHRPKIDYIVNWAKDFNNVLDAGCGRGEYMRAVQPVVDKVFGIELSTVCCDKFLSDVDHENTSILEHCATKPEKYDAVYSTDVLEHIPPAELNDTLAAFSSISDNFLFLVATGSDPKLGFELHISNHTFEEWFFILGNHFEITKKIKAFHTWPYIHIFECKNK